MRTYDDMLPFCGIHKSVRRDVWQMDGILTRWPCAPRCGVFCCSDKQASHTLWQQFWPWDSFAGLKGVDGHQRGCIDSNPIPTVIQQVGHALLALVGMGKGCFVSSMRESP